jgi:hypothetical protein
MVQQLGQELFFLQGVFAEKVDVYGKGAYPLRSKMTALEYLTDAPYACMAYEANVVAFA